MLDAKRRRGRPKGTGIDDSDRIARLAEMIRNYPELKPTTAIRVMGFTDPSVIRRLRDKYKEFLSGSSATAAAGPIKAGAIAPAISPIADKPAVVSRH